MNIRNVLIQKMRGYSGTEKGLVLKYSAVYKIAFRDAKRPTHLRQENYCSRNGVNDVTG